MSNTTEKGKNVRLEYRGMLLKAPEIKDTITHVHESNLEIVRRKMGKKVPICIWGKHGIGKTSIPEEMARERGIGFKSIAPAQFEEMGDLLGMPGTGTHVLRKDKDGKVLENKLVSIDLVSSYLDQGWEKDITKPNQTLVSPPEFVPNLDLDDPEEGFFVIDDFNRADGRIINGIMQLLQDGKLDSWELPKGWTIILTANPGGGEYQIKEVDDAQLTRMLHVSMEFEVKVWARWALNNDIDQRIVNFMLTYPELIEEGELTTPRTIEYFAHMIRTIPDLKKNLGLVNRLGEGTLDKNTSVQFTSFINDNLTRLITPKELLSAENIKEVISNKIVKPFASGNIPRVDVLNVISTRLIYYCMDNSSSLSKKEMNNLKEFLKTDDIPNDIRLGLAQEMLKSNSTKLRNAWSDPDLGKLLLERM